MPALHRVPAVRTDADVHVEPPVDDGAGNFGLALRRDVGFAQQAVAATRTLRRQRRQRHVVGFVDPRRHGTLGVRNMATARLAARPSPRVVVHVLSRRAHTISTKQILQVDWLAPKDSSECGQQVLKSDT